MKYKIFQIDGTWKVYSGHISYVDSIKDIIKDKMSPITGDWVKDDVVFWSDSIADCYAWIKAKQENLNGL